MAHVDITDSWLKRDGVNFVIERETILPKKLLKESIEKVLYGADTIESVLHNAVPYLRGIMKSMGVNLSLSLHDESFHDGKRICIGTDVIDSSLSNHQKVAVLFGLTIHESSHALHTDKKATEPIRVNRFLHSIWNTVEDERIEFLTCLNHPGYASFLAETKKYYFSDANTFLSDIRPNEKGEFEKEENRVQYEYALLHSIIRFPSALLEEDVEYFFNTMKEVKEYLTPYPQTNEQCVNASLKIFEYFKKFMKDTPEGGNGEGGDENKKFTDEEFSATIMEILKKFIESLKDPKLATSLTDTQLKKIDGTIKECEGHLILFEDDNRVAYDEYKNKVARYTPSLRKYLSYYEEESILCAKRQTSGYLDTNNLIEAVLGADNVHENFSSVEVAKLAVVILIDMSGSMNGSKMRNAILTAVMLNEAFKDAEHTKLFIYGHSADDIELNKVSLSVFREPGYNKPFSLGNCSIRANNRDGDAIELVTKRVRTFTKDKAILFVISDGYPCAYGYHETTGAIEHTREKVIEAEKTFTVIQIAIEAIDSRRMFKNFVSFTNHGNLPQLLNRKLQRSIKNI